MKILVVLVLSCSFLSAHADDTKLWNEATVTQFIESPDGAIHTEILKEIASPIDPYLYTYSIVYVTGERYPENSTIGWVRTSYSSESDLKSRARSKWHCQRYANGAQTSIEWLMVNGSPIKTCHFSYPSSSDSRGNFGPIDFWYGDAPTGIIQSVSSDPLLGTITSRLASYR